MPGQRCLQQRQPLLGDLAQEAQRKVHMRGIDAPKPEAGRGHNGIGRSASSLAPLVRDFNGDKQAHAVLRQPEEACGVAAKYGVTLRPVVYSRLDGCAVRCLIAEREVGAPQHEAVAQQALRGVEHARVVEEG